MLKKTITWTDYDGEKRTEDFYFHMTKADVVEWIVSTGNYTLDKVLLKVTQERNAKDIVETFKDLMRRSYGERTLDGRGFIKSDEVWQRFYSTEAYSQMFMELLGDAKKAADFFNAIIPDDLEAELKKLLKENPDGIPDHLREYVVDTEEHPKVIGSINKN